MNDLFFFLGSALIAMLLASIATGVIGSYVVVKKISFLSGSIAHSILGGMGLFLWLQKSKGFAFLDPIYGAFISGILSALLIGWVHIHLKQRQDPLIAAIWSTGMALGVIFISMTPTYSVELTNILFGNILWVSTKDLWFLLVFDFILLFCVCAFYAPFLSLCFDEEQTYLQGYSSSGLYLFLLSLVALSIVILIQVIGIILVLALLTLPVMIASFFTIRLFSLMVLSSLICAGLGIIGIALSYLFNFPMGATIALVCAGTYAIFLTVHKVKNSVTAI